MVKRLTAQTSKKHDEVQTPKEGILSLIPFLDKKLIIWECAYGGGAWQEL